MFTGLLEAAMPLCRTPEQRLFFQQIIIERTVLSPSYLYHPSGEPNVSKNFFAECLERLRYEGNTHLLTVEELQELKRRVDIKLFQRSRMPRGIYRIHQRSRMARVIYPNSQLRRVIHQIRHLLKILKRQITSLLPL